MGLEDFNKIQNSVKVENEIKDNKDIIKSIALEDIKYYLTHLDELVGKLNESYIAYVNSKYKYDFKKNDFQVNINWNEENNLRVANGLPKVTNQDQRNAIISLKLTPTYKKMKSCEVEYKLYKIIFDFISNNFTLLSENFKVMEINMEKVPRIVTDDELEL